MSYTIANPRNTGPGWVLLNTVFNVRLSVHERILLISMELLEPVSGSTQASELLFASCDEAHRLAGELKALRAQLTQKEVSVLLL